MKLLVLLNNLNMTTTIFGHRLKYNKARFLHLDIKAPVHVCPSFQQNAEEANNYSMSTYMPLLLAQLHNYLEFFVSP